MLKRKNFTKKTIFKNPALFLERIMSIIVFIAIIIAVISLWEPFLDFLEHRAEDHAFLEFIGDIFSVVIGIEFFKLLFKPGKDTLLEVLMFVVARHMIIEKTTPAENFISVVTIGLLFFIDRFLLTNPNFEQDSSQEETSDKLHTKKEE